jgi:hypothetical protein
VFSPLAMDPLTALSLAGNIIQFVEFGSKLLLQGYELYLSNAGRLEVDEELELTTADLTSLIAKLRVAGVNESEPSVPTGRAFATHQFPETTFQKICDEASKIVQAILTKLDALKIDENKNRKLETAR